MVKTKTIMLWIVLACVAASMLSMGQLLAVGAAVAAYLGYFSRVDWKLVRRETSRLPAVVPWWLRIAAAVAVWRLLPLGTWMVVAGVAYSARHELGRATLAGFRRVRATLGVDTAMLGRRPGGAETLSGRAPDYSQEEVSDAR